MINKSYKIWIILFVIINLLLLAWSLGYIKFFEEKFFTKDNIIVIEPDYVFKKSLPPKDESFPNEKSKVWGAFDKRQSPEKILQNDTELENRNNKVENVLENKNNKVENIRELESPLENQDNKLVDNAQIDKKPLATNQLLDKNSSEEKKPNTVFKTKKDKIQNKSKNNDYLEKNKIDKEVIFYVQVASLSRDNLVEKEWSRLRKKHSESMKNLIYISQKAELKDSRVFFRLLVGKFLSKNEANIFCDKLSIAKCIIKKKNE